MKTKILITLHPNNMKKIFFLIAFIFGAFLLNAQDNPFEELGYKPKIATLSKGQFVESFDNDTIVNIGSVMFNTKSKQIVAFVKKDTLYSEATLEPDIVSRWMSPDPLADHPTQVGLTPYHFAGNNPVYWNDPDGRCPWCVAWAVFEIGMAVYDAYDAYQTINDENLTTGQKTAIVGTTVASSIFLPGGGYGTAAKKVTKELVSESAEHIVKTKTDDLVKRADDMVASFKSKQTKATVTKTTAHKVAKVGEDHLKSLGGKSQVPFLNGKRVMDQVVGKIGYEAKTGYKTLTKDIQKQIANDKKILNSGGNIENIIWNFYRSPHTGKVGASKPLQKALKDAGIKTKIID